MSKTLRRIPPSYSIWLRFLRRSLENAGNPLMIHFLVCIYVNKVVLYDANEVVQNLMHKLRNF